MNDTTHEQKKNSLLKVLAILGLVGVLILLAWLSVQLVRVLPTAFSSLASLAESLNQSQTDTEVKTLTVSSDTTLAAINEPVTITWNTIDIPGHFTFSYQCTDGISIDLVAPDTLTPITCNTNYDLGNKTTLSFAVHSGKERYTDIMYTVSFFGTNDTIARASGNAQLTVINGEITGIAPNVIPEVPPEESSTTTAEEETVVVTTPSPELNPAPTTPPPSPDEAVTRPVTTPVVKKPEPVFVIPTSDPNGRTDLGTKFVSIGKIVNTSFVAGPVKQNQAGAIRFEIMNYGTKTSGAWKYTVTLPDGYLYTSPTQKILKPSERATITLSFPATTKNSHTFIVTVDEASDQAPLNDSFQQKVTFVK